MTFAAPTQDNLIPFQGRDVVVSWYGVRAQKAQEANANGLRCYREQLAASVGIETALPALCIALAGGAIDRKIWIVRDGKADFRERPGTSATTRGVESRETRSLIS